MHEPFGHQVTRKASALEISNFIFLPLVETDVLGCFWAAEELE